MTARQTIREDDEPVLLFLGKWNRLPYSYNVRRKIYYPMKGSTLFYFYHNNSYQKDMFFKLLKHPTNVYVCFSAYHFAGYGITPKPWELKKPPSRKEANSFRGPIIKYVFSSIIFVLV